MNDRVKRLTDEARVLTEEERVHLIEALWDTLPDDSGVVPVPDAHLADLSKRIDEHEADLSGAVPWEIAKARLMSRRSS